MPVTKVVLIIEYNGTYYHGFQLQASQPTIQGEIEEALYKLTGKKTRISAASRTDTGVHALGQVVSFRTESVLPLETFIKGLNHYLPKAIAVKAAHRVADSFNVRCDARSREYRYYILNSLTRSPLRQAFSYLVPGQLNIEAINEACRSLIGKHDLVSFASDLDGTLKKTVRTVYRSEVVADKDMAIFNMEANSFLPHQIRNTVGALIRVGLGKMTVEDFHSIIELRKPGLAGPTAPACGLFLVKVNYARPFEEEI